MNGVKHDGTKQNTLYGKLWLKSERLICVSVTGLVLCGIWILVGKYGWVNPLFISSPTGVVAAGIGILKEGGLGTHLWVSTQEFLIGMSLGIAVGVIVGVLLGFYRLAGQMMDPVIMALNTSPRTALLPILILWVGVGMGSKIAIVFLGVVLPVIVNTMVGIRTTDPFLVNIAKSFGAKEFHLLFRIMLPSATGAILTGIRLGYGRGLLGVIVGEMYVSTVGIGNQIMAYGGAFRMGELLFLVLITAFVGVSGVTLIRKLEERVEVWRQA